MSDTTRDRMEQFIRDELIALWSDLTDARDTAHNRCISIECENLIARIREATALVGPIDWRHIPVPSLLSGEYQQHCRLVGGEYTHPDAQELEETEAM